jgi:hypothetical protein
MSDDCPQEPEVRWHRFFAFRTPDTLTATVADFMLTTIEIGPGSFELNSKSSGVSCLAPIANTSIRPGIGKTNEYRPGCVFLSTNLPSLSGVADTSNPPVRGRIWKVRVSTGVASGGLSMRFRVP